MRAVQKVALLVSSSILCLMVCSLACKLYLGYFENALSACRSLLQINSELGWKQRPNLNQAFLSTLVVTNDLGFRSTLNSIDEKSSNLLILGPSSTFGWGVESADTYSAQLAGLLHGPRSVVNAGEIGFSSYQGLKLLKQLAADNWRPKAIILAYGINDLDRFRFFFQSPDPDKTALINLKADWAFQLQSFVFSTSLGFGLEKMAQELKPWRRLASDIGLAAKTVPPLRVELSDFERNVTEMIALSRQINAKPILVTSVYMNSATIGGSENETFYSQASAALHRNDKVNLRLNLEKAFHSEPQRIARDIIALNERIRKIAESQGAALVDIAHLYQQMNNDRSLFVDPVHPSSRGHRLIANQIFSILNGEDSDG